MTSGNEQGLSDKVPVRDEAEAVEAWEEYTAKVGHDFDDNPIRYTFIYRAFLAGFLAARLTGADDV